MTRPWEDGAPPPVSRPLKAIALFFGVVVLLPLAMAKGCTSGAEQVASRECALTEDQARARFVAGWPQAEPAMVALQAVHSFPAENGAEARAVWQGSACEYDATRSRGRSMTVRLGCGSDAGSVQVFDAATMDNDVATGLGGLRCRMTALPGIETVPVTLSAPSGSGR